MGARPASVVGPMQGIPAAHSAADTPHQRDPHERVAGSLKREEAADASCRVPPPMSASGACQGRGSIVCFCRDRSRAIPGGPCRKQICLRRFWATVHVVVVVALLRPSEATPSMTAGFANDAMVQAPPHAPFTRARRQASRHPIGRQGHPHRSGPSCWWRLLWPIVARAVARRRCVLRLVAEGVDGVYTRTWLAAHAGAGPVCAASVRRPRGAPARAVMALSWWRSGRGGSAAFAPSLVRAQAVWHPRRWPRPQRERAGQAAAAG